MRVRWAFEEVGQPYDVRLVSFEEVEAPEHLALHPFGRIPTFELGTLVLFESGAIVFHIAERHETVEPPIVNLSMLKIVERDKGWLEARLPLVEDQVRAVLGRLSAWWGRRNGPVSLPARLRRPACLFTQAGTAG